MKGKKVNQKHMLYDCFCMFERNEESRSHVATGRRNIFRLWKEKGWNAIEIVETIRPNSMNDDCLTW